MRHIFKDLEKGSSIGKTKEPKEVPPMPKVEVPGTKDQKPIVPKM